MTSEYEFTEIRERGELTDPTEVDVVCTNSRGVVYPNQQVVVRFHIDGDQAELERFRWKEGGGEVEMAGVDIDVLTQSLSVAIDVLEARDYTVETPFDHDTIAVEDEDDG